MTGASAFLSTAGWGTARRSAMASDAGDRRYLRLSDGDGRTAILMQAPVTTSSNAQTQFCAFRSVSRWLRSLGLSAPEEYAVDAAAGYMLLEDFGDTSLAALLSFGIEDAREAYKRAVDVLSVVAQADEPRDLPELGARDIADMLAPLTERMSVETGIKGATLAALQASPLRASVSLRDIHGDNLMWLPNRGAPAQIGLLDFQDATRLPDGYDIASLFDDPRRTVPEDWRSDGIGRYSQATSQNQADLTRRVALLSLIRNLRILGLFRGFALTPSGARYARFIPRTRDLIARAARHPDLGDLLGPVTEVLHLTAPWADVTR